MAPFAISDRLVLPIDEEDKEYQSYYDIAKQNPARIMALSARKLDHLSEAVVDHCNAPINKAHPVGVGFWAWMNHNKYMITAFSLIMFIVVTGGVEAAKVLWGA